MGIGTLFFSRLLAGSLKASEEDLFFLEYQVQGMYLTYLVGLWLPGLCSQQVCFLWTTLVVNWISRLQQFIYSKGYLEIEGWKVSKITII